MNRSVAVFDFDKTLTDNDTLFGFYKSVAGNDHGFFVKRMILIAAGVLYKMGFVKNDKLKSIGIALFLRGRTRNELEIAAREYAKQIKLNDIYFNNFQNTKGERWIISASPEIYLKLLFPDEKVAGTTFIYNEDKVKRLATNMFGMEKKLFLYEKGIKSINEFYTDSMSDKPLMKIADNVYMVRNGKAELVSN
jgi:phosphoserine phosphatase